jgi:hypothetical protein
METTDASGFRVFHRGDAGAAHALAHRQLDRGELVEGHRALGAWLDGRHGRGSQWAHLGWHMMVFELGLGHWDEAFACFVDHVLPEAASGLAPTDGPAGLWRLELSPHRRDDVALPWAPIARAARRDIVKSTSPFVVFHHLLAFAGAGDAAAIDAWLARSARGSLQRFARGLSALARGDYAQASMFLGAASVDQFDASRAQLELVDLLRDHAWQRSQETGPPSSRAA